MPSYLQTLPLHTITEVYGEAGLRDRFSREIERFAEPDWRRLNKALSLASDLHRQDRRAREPVVNHLLRVTLRVMCHYEVNDVDILVAALLHDTVEDHPIELAGRATTTLPRRPWTSCPPSSVRASPGSYVP
ncbi:hypothetical protein GCM10029978_011790 [Actinoallomurus acanthiterrae]